MYNYNNIKLFYKDFIDIALKNRQIIEKSKKYDLIF